MILEMFRQTSFLSHQNFNVLSPGVLSGMDLTRL